MDTGKSLTRTFIYLAFIASIAALLFALTLTILLSAYNYIGLNGSNSITVTSCADAYFTTKETGQPQMIGASFICTVICLAASTAIFVIMLIWILRINAGQHFLSSVSKLIKIVLYLLSNVAVLAAIPSMGYYLSDLREINRCATENYNESQVALFFSFSLLLLLACFCYYLLITFVTLGSQQEDEKYRDVSSQPTEPNQTDIKQKYYRYEPKEQPKAASPRNNGRNNENGEHTKENLNQSPTRNQKYFYQPEESPSKQYPSSKKKEQES